MLRYAVCRCIDDACAQTIRNAVSPVDVSKNVYNQFDSACSTRGETLNVLDQNYSRKKSINELEKPTQTVRPLVIYAAPSSM
jgi:hypothetical protein